MKSRTAIKTMPAHLKLPLMTGCFVLTLLFSATELAQAQTSQATAASATAAVEAKTAEQFGAGLVSDWFLLTTQLVQQSPGMSPPVAARAMAYMALALYESVVPGMPGFQSLAGQLNELESLPWAQPGEVLHWPTVANASLSSMARMMFPQATSEYKGRIDLLERDIALKYPADFDPNQVTPDITRRSQSFGKLMAMAIMTWARTDGGHEAWGPLRRDQQNYVPPSGLGKWVRTPPDFLPPLLPLWGSNRPFVLKNVKDCAAPAPPPYSEAVGSPMYKAAKEVYDISNSASKEQRQYALYWADDAGKTPTPAGHWVYITADLLKQASLAKAAYTFVNLNLAMADAFTAGWASKYEYNLLRPVTYVQITFDSNWRPDLMNTPPFPEYPSGHSLQSSAAAVVLNKLLGSRTSFTDNTHNDRGWGPRTFASFQEAANEAGLSRLYAGIHYRFAVEGGKQQGMCVGSKVLELQGVRP